MENKFKRFLSLMLALVMVIGLMPIGHAHAEEATAKVLGEMVTEVAADNTYVITLHGTKKALTNGTGRADWVTETRALVDCGDMADESNMWTLEAAEGGYKLKNGDRYLTISSNTGALNDTGHVFEFTYLGADGWTIKSLDSNNYFNNLGNYGDTIGGWTGDGTKLDIYTVAEKSWDEIDPFGKLRGQWSKVSVDTETVSNDVEGLFEYAFDGNSNTIWHSDWKTAEDKLTGENTFAGVIDFGNVYTINQFSFTPRVGNSSGQVTQASLYVKETEDAEWTLVAEHATFEANGDKKDINFDAQSVRYVKFVAEQSSDGWVAVSEFDVDYIAPAHEHTPAEAVRENEKAASCEENGSYDSVVYCSECDAEISRETITVPAEGHTPAEAVRENEQAATCGAAGSYESVVYCSVCNDELSRETVEIPATGEHTYDNACDADCNICGETRTPAEHVYDDDNDATCNVCGAEREVDIPVVSEKIEGVTGEGSSVDTTEQGYDKSVSNAFDGKYDTFWATVPNGNLANAYLIADLGGEYTIDKILYTKRIYNGSYDCTGNLLDYIIEVRVGENGEWKQVATGNTVDGTTEITFEPVQATHVRLTATQSYHWDSSQANTVMTVAELEIFGVASVHEHTAAEAVRENEVAATCGTAGSYESVVYCSVCNAELSRETVTVPATGEHTEGEAVHENEQAATCGTAGSYESVVYCSVCNAELSRENVEIPATGEHTYDNACDADCNICGETRTPAEHVYDDDNDATCNVCGAERDIEPIDPNDPWGKGTWVKVAVDSETIWNETEGNFEYAWDGDLNTIWHSNWKGPQDVLTGENTISGTIDFTKEYFINRFSFTPRQDYTYWENGSGVVLQASLYKGTLNDDGTFTWEPLAEHVVFEHNQQKKTFEFPEQNVRYVKFVAEKASQMGMTDSNGPMGYVAVAEFDIDYVCEHANTEIRDAVAPTCADGYTGDTYCTKCNALVAEGEAIPAVYPHTPAEAVTENEVDATCGEDGSYDTVVYCSVCNEEISRETITVPATGEHTPAEAVQENVIDATCTEDGSYDSVVYCSECDTEISRETVTVKASGHNHVNGKCECGDELKSRFVDVLAGSYYFDPVEWAVEKGITTGVDETHFNPTGSSLRAAVVTFLWRAAGSPEPTTTENPFTDVQADAYYYKAVLWAVEKGITNGVDATHFAPMQECSRAHVVTFLWRAQNCPESTSDVSFEDVETGRFYSTAVAWAVEKGITNGLDDTTFGVNATCNRAQVVTFLFRTMAE